MDIVGLVAGIVSAILAVVAIWQAMYFYSKGKDTETHVETALSDIKGQVETLQAVNAKITDRLTRYATAPRNDASQTSELLAVTLRSLPEIALKLLPPTQVTNEPALRQEIMLAYMALWHSLATANVWASLSLPSPELFDQGNHLHLLCKQVIDRTAIDFKHVAGLVSQSRQEDIRQSSLAHLYQEVIESLQPLVGDTSEHFARMSKKQP